MRAIPSLISTALLLLLAVSCQFKPDDHYINPIKPPSGPPNIVIDLTSPELTNPYFLFTNTTFTLDISSPQNPVVWAVVTAGTKSISASFDNSHMEFTLSPFELANGTHEVSVVVAFYANDGSIASKITQAGYQYTLTFTVIVDNIPPQATSELSAEVEDGYMTLRLSINKSHPYTYVVRKFGEQNQFLGSKAVKSIGGEFVFLDSGYVGQETTYTVGVMTQSSFDTQVGSRYVNDSPTTFSLVEEGGNTSLQWTSILKDAKVIIVGPGEQVVKTIEAGSAPLQTPVMGETFSYVVRVTKNLYPEQSILKTYAVGATANLPAFSDFVMINQNRFGLIVASEFKTYTLSDLTHDGQTKTSFFGIANCYSSYDGLRLGAGFFRSMPLLFSSANFSDIMQFRGAVSWSGSYIYPTEYYEVNGPSNNNYAGVSMSLNQSKAAGICNLAMGIDAPPPTGIEYYDSLNSDTPAISPDGQHFVLNARDGQSARIFKRNSNGTWTSIGNVETGKRFFRGTASPELIVVGATTIRVYSVTAPPANPLVSFTPLRSAVRPSTPLGSELGHVGYDRLTEHLWLETIDGSGYSTITTYDAQAFQPKLTARAYLGSGFPLAKHYYANNYHFLSTGYAQKITP